MEKLLQFLKGQKILSIASRTVEDIWIANVYYSTNNTEKIYFISSTDSKHSQMILKNPKIAFSVTWADPKNNKNRKGVQGLGVCSEANILETSEGIKLMYENFPDLRDILTFEWIKTNAWNTKVWIIQPSYIKYFDDEIYGDNESEEFNLL